MLSIFKKISGNLGSRTEGLGELYAHDKELLFRASNLVVTLLVASCITGILSLFFLAIPEVIISLQTKLIFCPLLLGITVSFAYFYTLVFKGRINLVRRLVIIITMIATLGAVTITGGFPNSVATPSIFLPVILAYCSHGSRVANRIAALTMCLAILQWICVNMFDISLPDYSSQSNPESNIVLVLGATFAFMIAAFYCLDQSNKKYIKKSETALEIKSRFLANMSHEIRTPMNGVLGFCDLMRKTELNDHQQTYMNAIHTSGKSLLVIINDILDLSKIEAEHIEISHTPFNFEAIVSDVTTLLSPAAQAKGINIYTRHSGAKAYDLIGDSERLRQIMINLVGNAVKFTEKGFVTVNINAQKMNQIINLKVEIQDTGIGIAKENLGKVFENFTQAKSSTVRKFGGTGLGLSICKKLVELMGGTIGVQSQENAGSTFWFEVNLPRVQPITNTRSQLKAA